MKRVIVVTGAGRSGTSLCMQSLAACGMRLSEHLLPPSEQNPNGVFEDADIIAAQKKLMGSVFYRGIFPNPAPWKSIQEVQNETVSLSRILNEQMEGDGTWGFKDPRTANLIQIWVNIFNSNRVVPIYFFCTRDPLAVRESLVRQYGMDQGTAELLWLFRTVWFLKGTGCRVFIVHYEEWFKRAQRQARRIARFAGLDDSQDAVRRAVKAVDASLNRSSSSGRLLLEESEHIQSVLLTCSGGEFDHAALNLAVDDVWKTLMRFPMYFKTVYDLLGKKNYGDKSKEYDRKIAELTARIERLEANKPRKTRRKTGT